MTREAIAKELRSRAEPLQIDRETLENCPRSEYIGQFPMSTDYDRIIDEDCDVYVSGVKVISFRKTSSPSFLTGLPNRRKLGTFSEQLLEKFTAPKGVLLQAQSLRLGQNLV